ncbi:MAG: DNA primase [Fimbriimonadales bacterium]
MRNLREEIRERIDIVELVSNYVRLERAGRNYKALCPFHTEKTPSFHVSPELNRFHCFGCGASGDVFEFLMRIEGLSFREAFRRLAEKAGIALQPEHEPREATDTLERLRKIMFSAHFFYRQCLQRTPHAQAYLAERGLTPETIEQFALGYAPDGWEHLVRFLQRHQIDLNEARQLGLVDEGRNGYYDRFRNRIVFPIHDSSGRVIALGARTLGDDEPKYLNSPETPLFEKRNTLYGFHLARGAILRQRAVLIVEGYLDLIMLHQYGFEHSVATLGTAFTEEHAQKLKRLIDRAYLVFDSDSAGIRATLRAGEVLMNAEVPTYVVRLPQGEDPDSLLRSQGAEPFQQALQQAVPVAQFGLEQVIERVRQAEGVEDAYELSLTGRTRLMQEALQWVASIPNPTEQAVCLDQLAPLSPRYLTNPQGARETLQRELNRLRRQQRNRRPTPANQAAPAEPQEEASGTTPVSPADARVPKAMRDAERTLLRACLQSDTVALVLPHLSELHWAIPEHAQLAEWFQNLPQPPNLYPQRDLIAMMTEEPLARVLTDLMLTETLPITPQSVADCITYLRQHHKRAQRIRLAQELLRSQNAENPEKWQEYWRLLVES